MRPSVSTDPPPAINPEEAPEFEPSGFDDQPSPLETQLMNATTVAQFQQIMANADTTSED